MKKYKSKEYKNWWKTSLGDSLLQIEQQQIKQLETRFLGCSYLQIGGVTQNWPTTTRPTQQYLIAENGDIDAEYEDLPIKTDSIDNVLLFHAIEYSSDPHQLIRETERVLVAGGKVVVVSFNPYSLWGLKRWLSLQDNAPWNGQFLSWYLIKDWLALLNFEVVEQHHIMFSPPLKNPPLFGVTRFMERFGKRLWSAFGGVSVMVAVKRDIPINPIMHKKQRQRIFTKPVLIKQAVTRDNNDE